MLEKLRFDLRNDTGIRESTEMDSLSSKNKEGLNSNNELRAKVDKYQKSLSERDEIIQQLTEQVDRQKESAEQSVRERRKNSRAGRSHIGARVTR